MSENKQKSFFQNMCRIGTPECAIFSAVIAMVLALLFLTVGFWHTVLIAVLMLLGAFLGGVRDKKEWVKNQINRFFPARQMVPYREKNPEIAKAVRRATEAARAREAENAPDAAPSQAQDGEKEDE